MASSMKKTLDRSCARRIRLLATRSAAWLYQLQNRGLLRRPCNHPESKERMSARSLAWLSASQLSTLFARRELSPVEAVEAMLARAAALQPHLNAFVLIDEAGAGAAGRSGED